MALQSNREIRRFRLKQRRQRQIEKQKEAKKKAKEIKERRQRRGLQTAVDQIKDVDLGNVPSNIVDLGNVPSNIFDRSSIAVKSTLLQSQPLSLQALKKRKFTLLSIDTEKVKDVNPKTAKALNGVVSSAPPQSRRNFFEKILPGITDVLGKEIDQIKNDPADSNLLSLFAILFPNTNLGLAVSSIIAGKNDEEKRQIALKQQEFTNRLAERDRETEDRQFQQQLNLRRAQLGASLSSAGFSGEQIEKIINGDFRSLDKKDVFEKTKQLTFKQKIDISNGVLNNTQGSIPQRMFAVSNLIGGIIFQGDVLRLETDTSKPAIVIDQNAIQKNFSNTPDKVPLRELIKGLGLTLSKFDKIKENGVTTGIKLTVGKTNGETADIVFNSFELLNGKATVSFQEAIIQSRKLFPSIGIRFVGFEPKETLIGVKRKSSIKEQEFRIAEAEKQLNEKQKKGTTPKSTSKRKESALKGSSFFNRLINLGRVSPLRKKIQKRIRISSSGETVNALNAISERLDNLLDATSDSILGIVQIANKKGSTFTAEDQKQSFNDISKNFRKEINKIRSDFNAIK